MLSSGVRAATADRTAIDGTRAGGRAGGRAGDRRPRTVAGEGRSLHGCGGVGIHVSDVDRYVIVRASTRAADRPPTTDETAYRAQPDATWFAIWSHACALCPALPTSAAHVYRLPEYRAENNPCTRSLRRPYMASLITIWRLQRLQLFCAEGQTNSRLVVWHWSFRGLIHAKVTEISIR